MRVVDSIPKCTRAISYIFIQKGVSHSSETNHGFQKKTTGSNKGIRIKICTSPHTSLIPPRTLYKEYQRTPPTVKAVISYIHEGPTSPSLLDSCSALVSRLLLPSPLFNLKNSPRLTLKLLPLVLSVHSIPGLCTPSSTVKSSEDSSSQPVDL